MQLPLEGLHELNSNSLFILIVLGSLSQDSFSIQSHGIPRSLMSSVFIY